jgi:hypothetical protein
MATGLGAWRGSASEEFGNSLERWRPHHNVRRPITTVKAPRRRYFRVRLFEFRDPEPDRRRARTRRSGGDDRLAGDREVDRVGDDTEPVSVAVVATQSIRVPTPLGFSRLTWISRSTTTPSERSPCDPRQTAARPPAGQTRRSDHALHPSLPLALVTLLCPGWRGCCRRHRGLPLRWPPGTAGPRPGPLLGYGVEPTSRIPPNATAAVFTRGGGRSAPSWGGR